VQALREISSSNVLVRALYRNRLLASIVSVHFLAALAAHSHLGEPFTWQLTGALLVLLRLLIPVFIMAFVLWRFAVMAIRVRPSRPIHWFVDDLRRTLLDADRLVGGAVAMFLFLVLIQCFSQLKNLVPLEGASWDPVFAAIDRAIHGGHDPYALLMPILGHPLVITFINGCYNFWIVLVYFITLTACFSKRNEERDTYLVAFALTWIVGGNVLAIALASGGPVYFALLGHGDSFAPLLAALAESNQSSPVWALQLQAMVWEGHIGVRPELGISAMPSMHVAGSVILALYGLRRSRVVGTLLSLFAAVIFLGSILLGWHYAVDGYVGALVALGSWALAASLVRSVAAKDPTVAEGKIPLWVGRRPGLDLPPGE
jgi:hypothetical protein